MNLPVIPSDIRGQRVLMRVDFNVPMEGGRIADDFRIRRTIPSIEALQSARARVILMAHLDADGERPTLAPIAEYCKASLKNFSFVRDVAGPDAEDSAAALGDGDVLLLENLRHEDGEIANTTDFSRRLAALGDLYVNEAFSASHRRHASIVGVPQYLPSFAGPLFQIEIKELSRAFNPPHPFLFVLGGKKISTKVPLVEKFVKKADTVVLGGVSAGLLLKSRGFDAISVEDGKELSIMRAKFAEEPKVLVPSDVMVERDGGRMALAPADVRSGDVINDFGPQTLTEIATSIRASKFILWNGPIGYCERGFTEGTRALAEAIADSAAEAIVGGGDTVRFLKQWGMLGGFHFVSTGGGAMLDFLVTETLPGIEALKSAKK